MEIGVHLVGSYAGRTDTEWQELRRTAGLVEDSGCTHLFLGENHLTISELTLRILEAARATRSLSVGPGATNIVFRHETSLLSTMSSVSDLVGPDRVFIGLGAGDTAFRMMGIPATTASRMRNSVVNMRTLMHGGSVSYNEKDVFMRGLKQMPFYMFAEGPKMMAVAAELADVIVYGGGVSPEAIEWARDTITEGQSARVSSLSELRVWHCCMVSIAPTEDEARQRIASRMANRAKHNLQANPALVPQGDRAGAERLLAEFNPRYWEATNGRLMTPYMFNRFGVIGTLDSVERRLHELQDAGVERLMIDFTVEHVDADLRVLASTILPDLISD